MLKCSVEGCDKKHFGIGLCKMHYARFKRNGNTDKVHIPHPKKCSIDGCNNEFKGRSKDGLCREHYLLNTKDKEYTTKTKHGRPKNEKIGKVKCKIEGCNKMYYGADYCRAHYLKYKKYGDPLKVIRKTIHGDSCTVLGCPDPYYLNDYCQKHYWRNQRYGSPYTTFKNNEHSEKCGIYSCNNKYYAKNLCKNHYQAYEYGMTSNSDIKLANAMNNVRIRDNYICQWYKCGKSLKDNHVEVHTHHIFPKAEYPDLMYEEKYMVCYCKFHHIYWHEKRYETMGKLIDLNSINFLKGRDKHLYINTYY